MSDETRLTVPALCLVWAEPVGGLGPLAHAPSSATGLGALRRLLRSTTGRRPEPHPEEPAMYAEAERLAASVARIARRSVRVRWIAADQTAAIGDIALDRRLLDPLPGWDLPHRVDALMGMTLRDAAHAARTPPRYRQELLDTARAAGLLPSRKEGDDDGGIGGQAGDGGPQDAIAHGPLPLLPLEGRNAVPPDGPHHPQGGIAPSEGLSGDESARPLEGPFTAVHDSPRTGEREPTQAIPASSHRPMGDHLSMKTLDRSRGRLGTGTRLRVGRYPQAGTHPQQPDGDGSFHRDGNPPDGVGSVSSSMDSGDSAAVAAIATQLVALFLVVEARHVDAWLADGFPGFRGYVDTYWLWRLPATDVARRVAALRGRASLGVVVDVVVAVMTGRLLPSSLPDRWRPLVEAVDVVVRQIDHDSSPIDRYAAAIAIYRLLKASTAIGHKDVERKREGKTPRRGGDGETGETAPSNQSGSLDDDADADRLAALEAFMAITLNGLDPGAVREGLTPAQQREVDALNADAAHRRGAGKPSKPEEEETSFVANQRAYLPGARPMRLITPAVTTGARMRYDATYARMRGQIDALRQVLKFRLAERRHAICAQTSGQLDEQALYRLAANDDRVFLRRSIESAPDQDLCILLDESASMGPGQVHVRAAVILFHHALQGMPGVRHWVFGFSGYGTGIALYRYISPSRSDLQQPQRLGAVSSREATPLAEAVAGAANAMLTEGQGREKLMIVVTDGHPDDLDGARRALRAAESRGVSIIGLGIAADAAAAGALFSHFTMYEDVASLHRKVGGLLRRVVGTH